MHVVRERTLFQFALCVKGLLVTTSFVIFAMTVRAQGAQPPQADPAAANPGNSAPTDVTNQFNNVLSPLPQLLLQNFFMPSLSEFPGRKGDEAILLAVQGLGRAEHVPDLPAYLDGAAFSARQECGTWRYLHVRPGSP